MNSQPTYLYCAMDSRERYERRFTNTFPIPFGDCYDENPNPQFQCRPAF